MCENQRAQSKQPGESPLTNNDRFLWNVWARGRTVENPQQAEPFLWESNSKPLQCVWERLFSNTWGAGTTYPLFTIQSQQDFQNTNNHPSFGMSTLTRGVWRRKTRRQKWRDNTQRQKGQSAFVYVLVRVFVVYWRHNPGSHCKSAPTGGYKLLSPKHSQNPHFSFVSLDIKLNVGALLFSSKAELLIQ